MIRQQWYSLCALLYHDLMRIDDAVGNMRLWSVWWVAGGVIGECCEGPGPGLHWTALQGQSVRVQCQAIRHFEWSEPCSGSRAGRRLKLQPAVRDTDSDCSNRLQNGVKACSKIVLSLSKEYLTRMVLFRMRAKTSEFLKVLNRAKIEEESKKKTGNRGAKSPFI